MQGFPGVIAANAAGYVGDSAVRTGPAGTRITLPPASDVTATLRYVEAATTTPGCDIVTATTLSIIPPDQALPLTVPFINQVCGNSSVPILFISSVEG